MKPAFLMRKRPSIFCEQLKCVNSRIHFSYDTDCCGMISRFNFIKTIGDRAAQELPKPMSIGGVGNAKIKKNPCYLQGETTIV